LQILDTAALIQINWIEGVSATDLTGFDKLPLATIVGWGAGRPEGS
jgi:hypothetical protein